MKSEIKTIVQKDFWVFKESKQRYIFLLFSIYFLLMALWNGKNIYLPVALINFLSPLAVCTIISGQIGLSIISSERASGMLEVLLVSELKSKNIVLGKVLFATTISMLYGLLNVFLLKFGSIFLSNVVDIKMNLILIMAVVSYLGSSLAIFIATYIKNEKIASITVPIAFMGIMYLEYLIIYKQLIPMYFNIGILIGLSIIFTLLSISTIRYRDQSTVIIGMQGRFEKFLPSKNRKEKFSKVIYPQSEIRRGAISEIKPIIKKDFLLFLQSKQKYVFTILVLYFVGVIILNGLRSPGPLKSAVFISPNIVGFAVSGAISADALMSEKKTGMLEILYISKLRNRYIIIGKILIGTIMGILFGLFNYFILKLGFVIFLNDNIKISLYLLSVLIAICYTGATVSILSTIYIAHQQISPLISFIFFAIIAYLEYVLIYIVQLPIILNIGLLLILSIIFTILAIIGFDRRAPSYASL